jgi:hypothetical protein
MQEEGFYKDHVQNPVLGKVASWGRNDGALLLRVGFSRQIPNIRQNISRTGEPYGDIGIFPRLPCEATS